jgi:hypothetical protein
MADISFLAAERRLVVSGSCVSSDSDAIVDAIEVFAGLADPRVLDVIGVIAMPCQVATSVIEACRHAEHVGHLVAIHTVEADAAVQYLSDYRAAARGRLRGRR